MVPYSRPKLSDLYTLSQSRLLENPTPQSGTYLYSPLMAVNPPPPPRLLGSPIVPAWLFCLEKLHLVTIRIFYQQNVFNKPLEPF